MAKLDPLALLLTLLSLALLAGRAAAEDWPQFRGPGGLAVSSDAPLPENLAADSRELAWKVRLHGEGISQPIVKDGRIYVTGAYFGDERARMRNYTVAGLALLALLALIGPFLRWWRGKRGEATEPRSEAGGLARLLHALDRVAIATLTLGFIAMVFVATVAPGVLWTAGVPGDVWINTGLIALAGLAAAFGWFPPRSPLRALGALVLLGCAAYVYLELPLNKHLEVYRLEVRLAMIAPALGGALWHLLLFFLARRRSFQALPLSALALAAMAAIVFGFNNYLHAGLMRAVQCYDLATGELQWDTPLFVAPEERLHRQNSFATPTPCTDGEIVFAYYGAGWACLDTRGKILWSGRDEGYADRTRYGCAASPIMLEDRIILLHEDEANPSEAENRSFITALDKRSGEPLWRIETPYAHDSYMTPLVMDVGGEPQLITVTYGMIVSYDPRSGEQLWKRKVRINQMVPGLCCAGDLLLVSGGAHEKWMTLGFRLGGRGKETVVEELWKTTRAVPDTPSPVLYDGCYYTVTREGGFMYCWDPESGKTHWRQRLGGVYLASLVAGDGKIYACTEEGQVLVLRAGKSFEEPQRFALGEGIRATPAIADGRILIRTLEKLYCFGKGG